MNSVFYLIIGLLSIAGTAAMYTLNQVYGLVDAATLETIKQYCVQHTDDVLQGKNPIQDLLSAGIISDLFGDLKGKTCADLPAMEAENYLAKEREKLFDKIQNLH